jgi:hypothetical protein
LIWKGLEWAAHGEQETAAELVLAGAVEDKARMPEDELNGLESTSTLSWCCGSIGLGLSDGSGGCRRWPGVAVGVR